VRVIAPREAACLSRLQCDQLLNGEAEDRAGLTAHVASCPRCEALLAAHRRERAVFAVPLRRARQTPRRAVWLAGAATAAAIAVWLAAAPRAADGPATQIKGKPSIGFFVKHRGVVRRGGPGEVVAPGDALNFTASVDHPSYLAILSRDGAQAMTAYYPAGAIAAPLPAGRDQVLPLAVVLDGVLGLERLHGVFCDWPAGVAQLVDAVSHELALPGGCVADLLTIDKRDPP
jgi:hypothetical protein